MEVLFIDMSSVRWCGTADVANPRPREVGGACRRQVLAGARTQETVGGPNGAQRSEFRRTVPPDNKRYRDWQRFPAMSWISVVGHAIWPPAEFHNHPARRGRRIADFGSIYLTWFTWWFCHTNMPQTHLHDHVAWPPAEFCNRLAETNPIISVSAVTY